MKYLLILFSVYLTSCIHKSTTDIHNLDKLTTWKNGSLGVNDLTLKEINRSRFKYGKNKLRILLSKKSFVLIYKKLALQNKLDTKTNFNLEWKKKKTKAITSHYKQQIVSKNISVTDEDIKEYFQSNLKKYTSDNLYNIYIDYESCLNFIECEKLLKTKLQTNSFNEVSLIKDNKLSGYYTEIPLNKLNKKIQNSLLTLSIGEISKPIKVSKQGFVFVKIESIKYPAAPKLNRHKESIKKELQAEMAIKALKFEKDRILNLYPRFKDKPDIEVFSYYAMKQDYQNDSKLQAKLKNIYDWLLADYGFKFTEYNNITPSNIRKVLKMKTHYDSLFTRYDMEIRMVEKDKLSDFEIDDIQEKLKFDKTSAVNKIVLKHILKKDFDNKFPNIKINIKTLDYNKWLGPKYTKDKIYWIKKTYQGLANKDSILIDDYKNYKRSYIASYENFMQDIGHRIDFKINPVIYSENWKSISEIIINSRNN